MSRRESIVSMAWSEKRCCPPLLLVVHGFQYFITDDDIQRVKEPRLHKDCSYSFQLVTRYFFLYFGLRLRLCSSFISAPIVGIESNMLNYFAPIGSTLGVHQRLYYPNNHNLDVGFILV